MKNIFALTLFIISMGAWALEPGQCLAQHLTKKYISFPDASAQYPKSYSFKCEYKCMNDEGVISRMFAVSSITLGQANPHGLAGIQRRNMRAEAKGLVCQGVQVKKVPWGYEFDYVKAFYSHKTLLKNIRKWAEKNVSKDNQFEITELTKAKEIILKSATAYLVAGSTSSDFLFFQKAGIRLAKIANELPYKTKELDLALNEYKRLKGILPSAKTELGLVLQQISFILNWKLPIL